MEFKDCEGFKKQYVVQRYTGNGVVEDNYVDRELIKGFKSKEKAEEYAEKLFQENNTQEQIRSTWCSNRYKVVTNTLHPKGLEDKKISDEERERELKEFYDNIHLYNKEVRSGITFYFKKGEKSFYDLHPPSKIYSKPIGTITWSNNLPPKKK